MKPSDTEIDTQLNSTKDTINLQSKQSKTHIKPISNDIIDIKLASLQISDNPLSSDDDLTITTKIQTITNNNHSISLNPWQDMLSSSITTSPENKSIHKNSDHNKDKYYSSTLRSNHESANFNNITSTLWNRNSNTVVWNKQNFTSRIFAPLKRHTSQSTLQSTTIEVWSKQSYDSHRKNHDSYNPNFHIEFMSSTFNTQSDNSSATLNKTTSNHQYPIATANGIYRLLQIDLNKITQQQNLNHDNANFTSPPHHSSSTTTTKTSPTIPKSAKRQVN